MLVFSSIFFVVHIIISFVLIIMVAASHAADMVFIHSYGNVIYGSTIGHMV